jgi:hypothetical protein
VPGAAQFRLPLNHNVGRLGAYGTLASISG